LKRRGRRVSGATIFFALLSIALAIILYVQTRCPAGPRPAPSPTPGVPRPSPTFRRRTATPTPAPRPVRTAPGAKATPAPGAARAAIVIDDLGNELGPAERIAAWKEPVAGAVLPGVAFSAAAARALERGGKEVLLHLPMEPAGYPKVRPGPGVILRAQSDEEIVRILDADLATVPGAVGVNNHMGSVATADARVMRVVARVLAGRGLFFLDSRTTDATVAEKTAEEALVPSVSRRVFLDDVETAPAIRRQLAELVRRAGEEGQAVAIGHPYPVTLGVLEEEMPGLAARGVTLVRVGELVR
jgi:polysaccharide deacetylase 2 family uncharacterized protein YibQ